MQAWLRIVSLLLALAGTAWAQGPRKAPSSPAGIPPQKQDFFYHYEWTRGAVLTPQEWGRGSAIEAGRNHLPAASAGEEWREIDRNYVLASTSTHAIVRVVAAPHATVPGRSGGEP
jgi:Ni/Co efflux regulator RcnB